MNSKRTRKRYNKNTKIIIIMVLTIGVIGLSIGFSAFSKNLNINSTATVTPDSSDFKVLFSSSDTVVETNPIRPLGVGHGTNATIDNNDPLHPKITGIKTTLTNPSEYDEWRFYVTNQGKYTAYLKKIEFGKKTCTAKQGTSQDLVNKACEGILLRIYYSGAKPYGEYITQDNITGHPLEKETFESFSIGIYYDTNASVADGDFDVTFGDITLTYSTTDS